MTNYTLPTNISTISDLGVYVNSVTNNLFGIGVMLAISIIVFTTLHRNYGLRISVGGSGAIIGIMGILWRFTGLTTDLVMFTCVMIGFGSVIYLLFSRDD